MRVSSGKMDEWRKQVSSSHLVWAKLYSSGTCFFLLVSLFVLLFSVKGNELLVILQRNLEIRIEFSINLA